MAPVDPRSLEAFAERPVYDESLKCRRCGYPLAGLPVGAPCPECGTATRKRRPRKRYGDSIVDAPAEYLRLLSTGFLLMAFSPAAWVAGFGIGVRVPVGGLLAAAAGVAWWVGVWIVTRPRPVTGLTGFDPREEHRWLRVANRLTQAAWAGGGVMQAMAVEAAANAAGAGIPGPVVPPLVIAMLAWLAVGLVGLGPLSVQMSDLADWANDTNLAATLRAIALVMIGCGGYAVVASPFIAATYRVGALATLNGGLYILLCFAWVMLVAAVLALMWTLFQMSRLSLWAVSNAASAKARDARLKEGYERARRLADAQRAMGGGVEMPRDARAVEKPRPCPHCGYDTTGLTVGRRCPECGNSIR